MSVGKDSILRAANADAKKTEVKVETKPAEEVKAAAKAEAAPAAKKAPTAAAGKKKNTKEVDLTAKLFDEIAPKYADRNGGYTRIVKIGQRKGDGALEVLLELV